jgi:hypothetical protein
MNKRIQVCGSALSSVRQCGMVCGSARGSVRQSASGCVRQCTLQFAALRQCGIMRQCGTSAAACGKSAVRQYTRQYNRVCGSAKVCVALRAVVCSIASGSDVRQCFNAARGSVQFRTWPRGTVFSQLPSAVIITVDHPLGSPSFLGLYAAVCSSVRGSV